MFDLSHLFPLVRFPTIASVWLFLAIAQRSLANPIVPANDGTNTSIDSPDGQHFDITGGTLSNDGTNLFQSFERFGLSAGQSATFFSNPSIQNILGRVTGGDPSIINGLLQVTGGRSNLFFMNPAGIVFGADARLNVPASFTATTATGIGFGNGNWFDATASGNWGNLVGNPIEFRFDRLQPGRLVNLGDLEVPAGETIDLFGGVVVNAGTLTAPEGNANVVAVEGGNLLRLSAEGHVLGLEVEPTEMASATATLAELLTGNAIAHADRLAVSETGEVVLSSSGTVLPDVGGDAIASGTIDVSGNFGGNTNVLGNRVALLGAIDASGTFGGGNVLVGGDVRGDGTVPTADFTFVGSDGAIDVSALQSGDGGTAIAWANDTTRFLGRISARGGALGGNGGFIETSGASLLESSGMVDASAPNGLAGTWLLDPNNITIQDAGSDTNVTGAPMFATTEDSAIVTTGSIENALDIGTSVSVATASAGVNSEAGDITVADPIEKTAGTEATLMLDADRDILVNAPISSTSDKLNVTLDAGGGVAIDADISANGGNVLATGASGLSSLEGHGVLIDSNRTIDAAGGEIALRGTGNSAIDGSNGIRIASAATLQTSGTGAIALTGIGGGSIDFNDGIDISGTVRSAAGNIVLAGTGNGAGANNSGIQVNGIVESTEAGAIALTGMGGSGTANNDGIFISFLAGSSVRSGGNITLTGAGGGTGFFNSGIRVGGTIESTGTGAIALAGTGSNGTDFNDGISITSGSVVRSDGGSIASTGTGNGTGTGNVGMRILGTIAPAFADSIALTGTGSNNADGIFATETLRSNGGDISISAPSDRVSVAAIDTSSTTNSGGNVTIDAANIDVAFVNAESIPATGGSVSITADENVRLTDTFSTNGQNASISTLGSTSGGTIAIRHGGIAPFEVGNAATNGSAGVLTRGAPPPSEETLDSGSFPFAHTQDSGRIQIIPASSPPVVPASPPTPTSCARYRTASSTSADTGSGATSPTRKYATFSLISRR